MRVAHVTLYPPKGQKHISSSGVASYSKNLVTHVSQLGDHHTVLCNVVKDSDSYYKEDDVTVRRIFHRQPNFVVALHKELKKINADVIHVQQELSLFGGITTAYLLQWLVLFWRRKMVVTIHGVVDPTKINKAFVHENNSRLPVWMVKLAFLMIYTPLMKWSEEIIVHEQYFKDIIVSCYGIAEGKVVVVPHGVEPLKAIEKNEAREHLKLSHNADVCLFMGYATGYKGIDLLIEGFAAYAKQNPNAYLVIGAGKHPKLLDDVAYLAEYARLQKKAADLIPKNQYRWEGFIDEAKVAHYYSASDVSLYPYTTAMSSSGPMSLAIGYEKPFLVSTAFAQIFGQYPKLLFDHGADNLAEKLAHFFTHREEYEKVSSEMKAKRNWDAVSSQTQLVYETVSGFRG